MAVLFLDLDHFKHISDMLGHGIGDRLLKSTAQRLITGVRGSDTVSRIGGDEFAVLSAHIECADDAAISAGKLLAALAEPHWIEGHQLHASTSIGISVYPDNGDDVETLIANADRAMFHAKDSGRNNLFVGERCAQMQGFHFGHPMAAAVFAQRLDTGFGHWPTTVDAADL